MKGLDNHEMVEAIHEGKLKAMYLFGEDMSLVDSNANYVSDAFSKLDFFVVQEIFFSDTVFRKPARPDSTDIKKRKQNNGSPDPFGAAAARCA